MNLSKSTLVLLAFAGLAMVLAASASADVGNEDWETATEVYDGNVITATVQAAGGGNPADEDWFRIFMTEGQILKLGMDYDLSSGRVGIRVFGPEDHTKQTAWSLMTDNLNAQEIDMYVFKNGTYYIRVYVFDGPGAQYRMRVRVLIPEILSSGTQVSNGGKPLLGRIDSTMWYRIWLEGGNSSTEICSVSMAWSAPTDTHLTVYDRKDDYHLNLLNYSWSRNEDHSESCKFAASYTGYYYIRVYTETPITEDRFATTFTLTATILESKWRADGNVVRSDAELVDIRQTVRGKINQAFDTHEWYKFYLNKGEQFSAKATITDLKLTTHWDYYNLTMYTHNGTIIAGAFNSGTTGAPISSCSIFLGRAPYTGMYYMSFSAHYSYSGSGTTDFTNGKLVNSCRYEIDVLIPNRRVWIIEPPGEVRMDEDDEFTLDLTKIFWDPEGDELTYGTTGGKENFTLPLSQSRGELTIRPKANWYGTDEITLWVHDGRPDQKNSTRIIITVRSIADPPYIIPGAPVVVRIYEDELNATVLDLSDIFDDVDIEDRFLDFSSDKNEFVKIEIQEPSGRVTLFGVENYNGEQRITFYATDSYNYRISHDILIIVIPTNDAPVPVGKIDRKSWDEGTKSQIDVGQFFFDIDGDDLYYYAEWKPEDAVAFDNEDSNPLNSWFDIFPEDPNFFGYIQVTFRCYDRDKLDPDMEPEMTVQTAIFEIKNVNDPPRIDVWEPDTDQTIYETESVTFKVEQNMIYDVDSNSFTWRWFVNDVEQVEVTGETFQFPKVPDYEDEGVYIIRCEVKDNLGEPATIAPEWVLTILNTNRAPTVYLISKDTSIEEGGKIRLRADGNDPDSDSLIFEWFQVDDAGREHTIGLGRDFTMDKPLLPGSYRFKCYVSDDEGRAGSEQVQVDVQAHDFPPTIPGFGALVVLFAFIGALGMVVVMRRRA